MYDDDNDDDDNDDDVVDDVVDNVGGDIVDNDVDMVGPLSLIPNFSPNCSSRLSAYLDSNQIILIM